MSPRRALGWSACALLLVTCFLRPRAEPAAGSFPARLFGPVASLAAGWQWVRVRLALEDGRPEVAYSRAELALELDPGQSSAWSFLASHLAQDRAAAERERDPARSVNWMRAALDLLQRGEEEARQPAELAVHRGLILVQAGERAEEISWPGGAAGAWGEAQQAFERAVELDPGHSEAWCLAAMNLGLQLGGPVAEPDPARRLEALAEALAILERGRSRVKRPATLLFQRGILLLLFAGGPDGDARAGGRRALYREAIEAAEAAEALGHRGAHALEASARKALEELE